MLFTPPFHRVLLSASLVLFLCFPAFSQSFNGITEAYNYSTISATVPGRIDKIVHREGQTVKKGQTILELEKDVEELEAARRKLIADSKIELLAARNQLDVAKRDYEATKQIYESMQSVSEEELWKKELDYKQASAAFERDSIGEQRELLESQIAQAELRKRVISAPFDGIVAKIYFKLGESCNAQEPLVKLVDVRKCRFVAYIPAFQAQAFVAGKKVTITILDSKTPTVIEGGVEFASPIVDPSSGLREIRAVFDNNDGKLKPGVKGTICLAGTP